MLAHLGAMLGHAGAILAIGWTLIGDLGADVGTYWWQAGARERKDGEGGASMGPWRLPDGKSQGGWKVKVEFWGPTHTQKTLRFSYCKPRILKISILEEILLL